MKIFSHVAAMGSPQKFAQHEAQVTNFKALYPTFA